MDLNDIFVNVEVLRALATVLAIVISLVIIYVITLWGGAKGAEHWRTIRGQIPAILEQFDEPTDSGPMLIDKVLDRLYKAQWEQMTAVFVPQLLEQVTKMVDDKLTAPPQEVNMNIAGAPVAITKEVEDALNNSKLKQ